MANMNTKAWPLNSRGEWFVAGQGVLILAVVLAPKMDGEAPSLNIVAIVGGVVCVVGLGLVALGATGLGRANISPFPKPRENAHLVTSGIFSVVRHPIYGGFAIAAFGWSLLWESVAAAVAALALLVFFDVKARREERWLTAKFSGYAAYKRRVKKLIPFVY